MQLTISDPFDLEFKRDFYSKRLQTKKFKSLYSKKYPEISNTNSGKMWDVLNFSRRELHNSPIYKDKILQITKYLQDKKGNLLNVGFGNGVLEQRINNYNLFGIDISEKSVKNIKRKIEGDFRVGNILRIPYKSNLFDCVLCLDVLEHISPRNTFKALKEINRVAKKNSILIISVPLNEGLEEMLQNGINPNAHVRVYTENILKMELKISGFDVEKLIFLSAFNKNYSIKKLINGFLNLRESNLLIVIARKK